MSAAHPPRVVPAQLSFLAIYNPALGDSDETFHRQIVFYHATAARARARDRRGGDDDGSAAQQRRDDENEKLRQVGLAQGMVSFARSFSRAGDVDAVETDKARIVLHQLEPGWWILAAIDLTQLPAAPIEYSSREVSPPALLVQQLVRAHGVFALHHGWPLDQLLAKHGRPKFCSILATYWARFCASWDVLLHGSPAVDMFNGLKLAAGGELGVGVGEEDWGSSERDVLEDFARRTEGLVDVVVSRFGDAAPLHDTNNNKADAPAEPWMGTGGTVAATDGVVFSGVGGLSRASLRDVSHWAETIYHYGDHAYGIRDNPTSDRRKRRRRHPAHAARQPDAAPAKTTARDKMPPNDSGTGEAPRIPPPIVSAVESSLDRASKSVDDAQGRTEPPAKQEAGHMLASLGDTETWMKYMTLGYGTAWGGKKPTTPEPAQAPFAAPAQAPFAAPAQAPFAAPTRREQSPEAMRYVEPTPDVDLAEEKRKAQVQAENAGYFLVGLKGDMAEADMDDDNDEGNWNARIPLRTVYVEQVNRPSSTSESDDTNSDGAITPGSGTGEKLKLDKQRLRPVVYVHRPFIYTFLFTHRTPSLTLNSFYRSLHAFFTPLHRSLDRNTMPSRVAQRLLAAQNPQTTTSSTLAHGPNASLIYDLVWDPRTLTVHSSLPNIPDPGTLIAEGLSSKSADGAAWSRLDALNVHAHILATLASTRQSRSGTEIERSCKTARGWWVVWLRVPPSEPSASPNPVSHAPSSAADHTHEQHTADSKTSHPTSGNTSIAYTTSDLREAFLVRRARDAQPPGPRSVSGASRGIASGMWTSMGMGAAGQSQSQSQRMGGKAAGWGPKGLAEGIGIDARRYVDELLSLNR